MKMRWDEKEEGEEEAKAHYVIIYCIQVGARMMRNSRTSWIAHQFHWGPRWWRCTDGQDGRVRSILMPSRTFSLNVQLCMMAWHAYLMAFALDWPRSVGAFSTSMNSSLRSCLLFLDNIKERGGDCCIRSLLQLSRRYWYAGSSRPKGRGRVLYSSSSREKWRALYTLNKSNQ